MPSNKSSNDTAKLINKNRTEASQQIRKIKIRRGQNAEKAFAHWKIMFINIRGYKSKKGSLDEIIKTKNPDVLGLVETMLNEKEKINLQGYFTIRNDRDENGGGILFALKTKYENIVTEVCRSNKHDKEESLWIIIGSKTKIRTGIVYMPQENKTKKAELTAIYNRIHFQVEESKQREQKLLLMGDFNCKIGKVIKGNTSRISKGGKILLNLCKKSHLTIANTLALAKGIWTRVNKNEKSALDYIIVNTSDENAITLYEIDESKLQTPYRIVKEDGHLKQVYSDHNMIECNINWKNDVTNKENETKYIMTEAGYNKYKNMISKRKISNLIQQKNGVQHDYDIWTKEVMNIKPSSAAPHDLV